MSEIELSGQLLQDVQQAVLRHRPDADPGVIMQHLAAVVGYLLAQQRGLSDEDRRGYLDELCAFARHVVDDALERQRRQLAVKAFGYWTPPKP